MWKPQESQPSSVHPTEAERGGSQECPDQAPGLHLAHLPSQTSPTPLFRCYSLGRNECLASLLPGAGSSTSSKTQLRQHLLCDAFPAPPRRTPAPCNIPPPLPVAPGILITPHAHLSHWTQVSSEDGNCVLMTLIAPVTPCTGWHRLGAEPARAGVRGKTSCSVSSVLVEEPESSRWN